MISVHGPFMVGENILCINCEVSMPTDSSEIFSIDTCVCTENNSYILEIVSS
jgi:hypothetical protein